MSIVTVLVLSYSIIGTCLYFQSETYLGKEYVEVHRSNYTTDEERKLLGSEITPPSALPREYYKTPGLVKAKIKRNKEILRQWEMEARANKGKFTTKIPLEC